MLKLPTSGKFLKKLMDGSFEKIPVLNFAISDVRDVAEAHVQAIEKGKDGTRYIASNFSGVSVLGLVDMLQNHFKNSEYIYPKNVGDNWNEQVFDWSSDSINLRKNKNFYFDNQKCIYELGVQFRKTEDSLIDMVNYMTEYNL